jgi:hypothetical protein
MLRNSWQSRRQVEFIVNQYIKTNTGNPRVSQQDGQWRLANTALVR